MKDLLVTDLGKGKVEITAQTELGRKIFRECGVKPNESLQGTQGNLHELLSWATSHSLSVDCSLPVIIPTIPRLERAELAKMFPSVPAVFLPRTIFAIGKVKFKGDAFGKSEQTKNWSVNEQFDKGVEYPVYDHEGLFVVGKDGKAYKMTPAAWTKMKIY